MSNDPPPPPSPTLSPPVVAPHTTNPPRSGAAVGAALAVGVWWIGLLGASWMLNILDWRLGRVAVMIAAGGSVFVALITIPQTRRLPRSTNATAAVVVGALFLAFAVSYVPPGYYRLRAEFHRIPDPPGWTTRDEEAYGNSVCFDVCKSIERELIPDIADPERAASAVTRMLERNGYRLISEDSNGTRRFRNGDFEMTYSYDDGQPVNSVETVKSPRWSLKIQAWHGN